MHTWQSLLPHTFRRSSHPSARARRVPSQSSHGHRTVRPWTLDGRTQHMMASATIYSASSESNACAIETRRPPARRRAFHALAGAKWKDDLVRARAKELGMAMVAGPRGTTHTSVVWPPARPLSSESPRPCWSPLTVPTAVEVCWSLASCMYEHVGSHF